MPYAAVNFIAASNKQHQAVGALCGTSDARPAGCGTQGHRTRSGGELKASEAAQLLLGVKQACKSARLHKRQTSLHVTISSTAALERRPGAAPLRRAVMPAAWHHRS